MSKAHIPQVVVIRGKHFQRKDKIVKDFIILNQVVSEKTLMKNDHMCYIGVTEGTIENLIKEGKMRISILIFIYTLHFAYLKVYTNFIILNQVVTEKTLTKNVHMCYIGVTEGKIKKEGKMRFSIFKFDLDNTLSLHEGVKKM